MKKVIVRRIRPRAATNSIGKNPQNGLKLANSEVLKRLNPTVLDLGDIGSPSQEIGAIAAVFDLSGFTKFCNQVDAHLAIPKFLNGFLDWFFSRIKIGLMNENNGGPKSYWTEPPVLVKFLGDGLLLLWNTRRMPEISVCKIVTTLYDICYAYRCQFYPKISTAVVKPPAVLRCGLARGKVFSIGNGKDYVGHCINTASRLVQLRIVSFCFPHRGFQVQEYMPDSYYHLFIKKRIFLRGFGEDELVWMLKDEFDRLPEKAKGLFSTPDDSMGEIGNVCHSDGIKTSQVEAYGL